MILTTRNAAFVLKLRSWTDTSSPRSSSNAQHASIKVSARYESFELLTILLLQLIHRALRCRRECSFARSPTNGSARSARLAASAARGETTKCFTAFSATAAFTFIVWHCATFPKVRDAQRPFFVKFNFCFLPEVNFIAATAKSAPSVERHRPKVISTLRSPNYSVKTWRWSLNGITSSSSTLWRVFANTWRAYVSRAIGSRKIKCDRDCCLEIFLIDLCKIASSKKLKL